MVKGLLVYDDGENGALLFRVAAERVLAVFPAII